ncbi:L-arabinose transport system permease protein AraQ [subsurface metagenome]
MVRFNNRRQKIKKLKIVLIYIIVAGSSTVIALLGGAMVGYAFSRLQFKGRDLINNFLLFHMFYPGIILLVPLFLLVVFLGFYNTYLGMILPKALSLWAIFLYSSFFLSIPKEIIEAARLDNASELQIIFQIMIPISWPITTVIGLLVFLRRWSELLWDMVVIQSYGKMTLNVLLAIMSTGECVDFPGPMYAANLILTFPVVVLFLIFGKGFIKGISLTIK